MARSKKSRARGGAHRALSPSGKPIYRDWLWWPNEPGRRSRAQEEFERLPKAVQAELLVRIQRFLAGESRFKDVDDLGGGIKEIRYRFGNNHYRVLFFVDGDVCVALTCFYKNQQRPERVDLDRARKRRASYIS